VLALLAPAGAAVGLLLSDVSGTALGFAVGLSAGTFLYISTSDLLPEAHERGWRYYGVPVAFAAGFVIMLAAARALG
jgi:zinc and cadmium transporter